MEIMVALGLLATISLLVIGTLARLLSVGGKSSHQTAATLLAQDALDSAAAVGPPTWGSPNGASLKWSQTRELVLPNEDSKTPFECEVSILPLRRNASDLGSVFQVTSTVSWWGESPEGRVEQGRTSVTATRTVYVRGELGGAH